MNSTDEATLREMFGALFDDVVEPLGRRGLPFPMAPDGEQGSYYVERAQPAMKPADFCAPSCLDGAELAQRLAAHWHALGRDELVGCAGRIAQVACAAQVLLGAGAQQAEVSPYIYAMF